MPKGTNEVGSPPVLTDRGYVQVLASRRGMGRSGGTSGNFLDTQEVDDYVQAIAWAAAQPWCNGDVCLFGTSYYGLIQPLVAARRPPALRAMFAHEICTDMFRHLGLHGGAINNRFFALWLGANFKDSDFQSRMAPWQRAVASQLINRDWLWDSVIHPKIESIYEGFLHQKPARPCASSSPTMISETKTRETFKFVEGASHVLGEIQTPFVVVQNQAQWNIHQFGSFDLFERAGTPAGKSGSSSPSASTSCRCCRWQLEALAFFDHVVKGCDNGYDQQAPVRYWRDGAKDYAGAPSFPPPDSKTARLFLDHGPDGKGALSPSAPSAGSTSWTAVPKSAPMPDGMDEVMAQTVSFDLPCPREAELAGPVTASVRFSCNEIDSHVVAALSRVDREGKAHLLTLGAIRPAQRTVDAALTTAFETVIDAAKVEPLRPGEAVNLRFSLVPTAAHFAEGERLRLTLASRTDLVKGKLADGYVHFDLEVPPYFSRNTVHHGPDSWVEVAWK